jgi:hypothetical protein
LMGSFVFCAFHSHSNICCPLLPSLHKCLGPRPGG